MTPQTHKLTLTNQGRSYKPPLVAVLSRACIKAGMLTGGSQPLRDSSVTRQFYAGSKDILHMVLVQVAQDARDGRHQRRVPTEQHPRPPTGLLPTG